VKEVREVGEWSLRCAGESEGVFFDLKYNVTINGYYSSVPVPR